MVRINISSVGIIATLMLGVSGLVMNPFHRRHAANVLSVRDSEPVVARAIPLPHQVMSERRSTRQKRCLRASSDSLTPSPSPAVGGSDAPANFAATPTPAPASAPTRDDTPEQDPQPDTSGGSGGADTFSGQLTYYDVGLGSCGTTNSDDQMVAAVSKLLYDGFDGYTGTNPNLNPICGRQVAVTYEGKEIQVTIVDRCDGCARGDLDLSPTAFGRVADHSLGRLNGAKWHFI